MSKPKIVELIFIDGPLRGTYKFEDEEFLIMCGHYRYLQPLLYSEKRINISDSKNVINVNCAEWHYVPIRLPPSITKGDRYAMVVKNNI